MTKSTDIKPSSDFYWGALAMKSAMLAAHDVHVRNIELGFPAELVLGKLRDHLEMITADMVFGEINQNIGEKPG
jgi:hypothetical protein